jgi:hypothetical protein
MANTNTDQLMRNYQKRQTNTDQLMRNYQKRQNIADQLIKQLKEESDDRFEQLMADHQQQQANTNKWMNDFNSNIEQRPELVTLKACYDSTLNAQKAKYALEQKDHNDKYAVEITELKQQLERAKQSPF